MTKRKKLPEETVDSGVVPFTSRNVPNQVASRAASQRQRTPRHADGACDRRPLEQARAPEVLAQMVGVVVQVRPVEVDVAVDVGNAGRDHGAGCHRVSSSRERRQRAKPALLPHGEGQQGRQQRKPERKQWPQVAREQRGDGGRRDEKAVRRLHADRKADHEPGGDAVERGASLERAHEEEGADEQEEHRLEVGETGEAERTGQELLDVALVVVVAPEWDDGEGQHHPRPLPRSSPNARPAIRAARP